MGGKIFNVLGVLSISTLLAAGGFAVYLAATDRLNAQRLETIAAVLRASSEPPAVSEASKTGGPSTDPAVGEAGPPTRQAAEEAQARRQRERLEGLEIERAVEDLRAQERVLDQIMAHVVQQQEDLAQARREFEEQQKKLKSARQDEGFAKELALVSGMKPAQAKEHLVTTWNRHPADAIRLLKELDQRQAKRILEQMRTEEELRIMSDLLEQIRIDGTEGYATSSGRTAGDAAP